MAPAAASGWLKGRMKVVPLGDSMVIMANTCNGIPPEKIITLSSLIAPRLARKGGNDEPFAWDSREHLRELCIRKEVTFRVDYILSKIGQEFCSIFLGEKNIASLVVSEGWEKIKEHGQDKTEASPFLAELLHLEEQAKLKGFGIWSKVPGTLEASVRKLPPSVIGASSNLDVMDLLAENKGSLKQRNYRASA